MTPLPDRAQVVVIGGGIIGASVAYHLTELGLTDLVLIEQGQLSSGTTWHAAGLVGQLRASETGTRLVQYSAELYQRLEAETGLATGYKECGGVTVARTPERWRDRSTVLFDTVAVYLAFSEAGLEMETLNLAVRDDGLTAIDRAGDPVRVAAAWTDYAAFEALLVDRLCR